MSMIKRVLLSSFTAMICMTSLYASEKEVLSPDGRLKVDTVDEMGEAVKVVVGRLAEVRFIDVNTGIIRII